DNACQREMLSAKAIKSFLAARADNRSKHFDQPVHFFASRDLKKNFSVGIQPSVIPVEDGDRRSLCVARAPGLPDARLVVSSQPAESEGSKIPAGDHRNRDCRMVSMRTCIKRSPGTMRESCSKWCATARKGRHPKRSASTRPPYRGGCCGSRT